MAVYLERRIVSRFVDSTARATRTSRAEGEVTYLQDSDSLWVYNTAGADVAIAQLVVGTSAPVGSYPPGTVYAQV